MRQIIRLVGAVAIGAAVALLAPTAPASAHTAAFNRTCDVVKLKLNNFPQATEDSPNKVHVFRGLKEVDVKPDTPEVDPLSFLNSSTEVEFPEPPEEDVTYRAMWKDLGPSKVAGQETARLVKPRNCGQVAIDRACDGVKFTFSQFVNKPNKVGIERDGQPWQTLTWDGTNFTKEFKEDSLKHKYEVFWVGGSYHKVTTAPQRCGDVDIKRDCFGVKVHLEDFPALRTPIRVLRDGEVIETIEKFKGGNLDRFYRESDAAQHKYQVTWLRDREVTKVLARPRFCATGKVTTECDKVMIKLDHLFAHGDRKLEVLRDGEVIDTQTFSGKSKELTYDQQPAGVRMYEVHLVGEKFKLPLVKEKVKVAGKCEQPTTPAPSSAAPPKKVSNPLPLTGQGNLLTIIGVGVGMLIAGAVALFVVRRRAAAARI